MHVRETFLKNHWLAYPARPEGDDWEWGRLVEKDVGAVTLWRSQATTTFRIFGWEQWGGAASEEPSWFEVVQPQDWLAVHKTTGKLLLLAPALEEPIAGRIPEWAVLQKWSKFLSLTREFFARRDFVEVHTPTLVASPGTEPWITPFQVELLSGGNKQKCYLPFSPEFHLKKMVSLGGERVFEIARCYRNGDFGPWHQAEFWMLEWYEAFADLKMLQKTVVAWLQFLEPHFAMSVGAVEVIELAELFKTKLSLYLTPNVSAPELQAMLKKLDEGFADDDQWEDLFSRLMLRLEPMLGLTGPMLVTGFPARLAQLARVREDGWADRCELYWNGVELGNGFHELTNPFEQEQRSQADLNQRALLRRPNVPLDPEFFRALRSGLPPTAGIAIGLERLFAQYMGFTGLEQVRPFPVKL